MTDKQEPWDHGVFKGADGLRKLVDSQPFWDEQSYGTRLYFGPNITDYLHRDVLRAAVEHLERAAPPAQPDHQGHSCTHKCTWPQCEAAQPAPAQEPQPVSNTDELPQRLSDERIRSCVEAAGPRDESTLKKAVAWYRRFADQIEAAIVPPGYVVVPVEIVSRFPEINPSNYGPDEVDALNAWGIELAAAAAPKASHDPR